MPAGDVAGVVCRRGHVQVTELMERRDEWVFGFLGVHCKECGAATVVTCPACSKWVMVDYDGDGGFRPYPFCTCGVALPWAGRDSRIHALENLLDQQELAPAEALAVREQLGQLADPNLPEDDEASRWRRVLQLAPRLWTEAGGRVILTDLITAEVKRKAGFPP